MAPANGVVALALGCPEQGESCCNSDSRGGRKQGGDRAKKPADDRCPTDRAQCDADDEATMGDPPGDGFR